jgi:hypothetical protein
MLEKTNLTPYLSIKFYTKKYGDCDHERRRRVMVDNNNDNNNSNINFLQLQTIKEF